MMDRKFLEWIEENLRDPESALWKRTTDTQYRTYTIEYTDWNVAKRKHTRMRKEFSGFFACYKLNSKNGYGGYAGSRRVVAYESFSGDGFIVLHNDWRGDNGKENLARELISRCPL
ncbi:hypothetical protein [Altererythrobacter sp. GH1-8]|uniref:hypothetical protein n=1 Tax=Altererythrobacter sp. GH1-8 TaxID=3349333 RepID=UPI00374D57D0